MSNADLSIRQPALSASTVPLLDRVIGPMARRQMVGALAHWQVGRLTVHMPDGEVLHGGAPDAAPHVTIWIDREAFFTKFALRGDMGAGEAYMDGDWRTDDLAAFVGLVLRNQSVLPLESRLTGWLNAGNNWLHRRRANTRDGSRRNIGAHYDLSNDLFRTFLDPSMAYSSGVYLRSEDTLEQAQQQKFERWCQTLHLSADDHVLEIGSGWGGLALHAARTRGCRVTGITVSREQLALSTERARAEGL